MVSCRLVVNDRLIFPSGDRLKFPTGGRSDLGVRCERGMHQSCFALLAWAVRIALNVDRRRVVQQPTKDRTRNHGVAERLAPRAQALITGLEEEVCALAINQDVADLVDDQELRSRQHIEPLLKPVLRRTPRPAL